MNASKQSYFWTSVLFAMLQLLLVTATVYVFLSRKFAPPAAITSAGLTIDRQYHLTLVAAAVVFVLSQLGLGFVVMRYRDHGQTVQFFRDTVFP